MNKTEEKFILEFDEWRAWIRDSVTPFADDTEEGKLERITRGETDKIYFSQTYLSHYIEDDFADIHTDMFKVSDIINKPVVIGGAREIAKSTIISFFDEIHKTVYRKNKFTEFVSDTRETAVSEFLIPIKAELEANERLINDFGEQKTKLWGMDDFTTKSGKRFLALGPRMGVKGKRNKGSRPDRIVIEDMENINSPTKMSIIRRKLKWIKTDLMKSVNSKKWQLIYIGNYFSKKTIIHILLTSDDYKHWIRKLYPAYKIVRNKIKSVWESRLSSKMLQQEFDEDPITFRSERGQKPEDEDSTFNEAWIKHYNEDDIKHLNLPTVTAVDPSAKQGEEHCYKAVIALSVDPAKFILYVRYAWIRKTSKWRMVRKHFDVADEYNSLFDGVESTGFQSTLKEDYEIEEQARGKSINIKLVPQHENKKLRIASMTSFMERGKILFLKNHSDQNKLIEQFLDFPDGDIDGPDALEQAKRLIEQYVLKKTKKIKSRVLGED